HARQFRSLRRLPLEQWNHQWCWCTLRLQQLQQRCPLRQLRCSRGSRFQPLLCHLLKLEGLRLLTGVWVLCTVEDVKLLGRGTGKLVVWHHANNCFFDYARWVCVQGLAQGHGAQTTRVTGVVVALFTVALVRRNVNLFSVDDDDVVTTV